MSNNIKHFVQLYPDRDTYSIVYRNGKVLRVDTLKDLILSLVKESISHEEIEYALVEMSRTLCNTALFGLNGTYICSINSEKGEC